MQGTEGYEEKTGGEERDLLRDPEEETMSRRENP